MTLPLCSHSKSSDTGGLLQGLPRISHPAPWMANISLDYDLRGHVKTGQRWSGQNRPTEVAGD